jgi:hypothetical protein
MFTYNYAGIAYSVKDLYFAQHYAPIAMLRRMNKIKIIIERSFSSFTMHNF